MKIVVTGSSGYVGSGLLQVLAADPSYEVIGIDRRPPGELPGRFDFVQCDLAASAGRLDSAIFDGVSAVIHLAAARGDWAISHAEYWRDNVQATDGLLDAPWASRVPIWVFMSSVSAYGPADTALTESSPCRPIGPYGESKLASEQRFSRFINELGARGCVIRPSAVFSAGHPANTNVYKLIESLRRMPIPLIGAGANRKTLTYLPNLIELVLWCLRRMQRGGLGREVYNFVEEPVLTVAELIAVLRRAGIRPARTVSIPMSVALAAAYPVYGLARAIRVDLRVTPERVRKYSASTWYDSSKVRREGFAPSVGLEEALTTTVAWHLARR